jgi:NADPH:quinone reductase-like Zn-dependent oxidoreductase
MIIKMARMPRFDAMDLVLTSKRIAGFNLSFFSDEHDLIAQYMDEILSWLQSGSLTCPDPTVFPVSQIADAHELIQSGQSVGKIVVSL